MGNLTFSAPEHVIMSRPRSFACLLVIVIGASAVERPADGRGDSPPAGSATRPSDAERLPRELARQLKPLVDGTLARQLDGQAAELVKQAEAIVVSADARRAGTAIARSDFERALRHCRRAIDADPNDAYALYLAGIAVAELRQWADAERYFARAHRACDDARTAHLLAEFCRAMRKGGGRSDDEAVLTAFAEAFDAATKALGAERSTDLLSFLMPPPLVMDPLLCRIDLEAIEGRGPRGLDAAAIREAAVQLGDPYALWLAAQWCGDPGDLNERLADPRHAGVVERLQFLATYFGEDKLYQNPPPAFHEALRRFHETDPDEGLWLCLQVPFRMPEGDRIEAPPLALDELAVLERALAAPKFTDYHGLLLDAGHRILGAIRYPYSACVLRSPSCGISVNAHLRNIGWHRAGRLAKTAAERDDAAMVRRAVNVMLGLTDVLKPSRLGYESGIQVLQRSHMRQMAAETALETLGLSIAERKPYQNMRLAMMRDRMYRADLVGLVAVAEVIPNRDIIALCSRIWDDRWEPWESRLVTSRANRPDVIEEVRSHIGAMRKGGATPNFSYLIGIGARRQRAVASALRDLPSLAGEDDIRWALIWTAGELEDSGQIPWLIECLERESAALQAAALEALRKITGRTIGMDAAAWRRATSTSRPTSQPRAVSGSPG